MAKDATETTRSTVATGSEVLSPPADRLPGTSIPPATDRRVGMTENSLHDADEFVTTTTYTTRSTFSPDSEAPSPPTDRLTGERSALTPPATDQRAEISPAEIALRDANEAIATINLSKTWEGSLERIKWVMDTLSPVAGVRCSVLFCRFLTKQSSSSAPSVRTDGIWSTFFHPQGDPFAPLQDSNTYVMFLRMRRRS